MRTILVLCESGYWHDLRSGLNQVGISFLGFDKKNPIVLKLNSWLLRLILWS